MNKHPEWVKHIRHTHAKRTEQSWCGQPLPRMEWAFTDIDHAAYERMNEGHLLVCPECVAAVTTMLRSDGAAPGSEAPREG